MHPDCEDKPVVIGNCQAGWAIMLMAAAAPDFAGVICIAGSPLSYWAGTRGKNPMRYTGGLLGGSWLASFVSDLGNGTFDGVHLVSNFETLDPANTLWSKQYDLYSKIDTEEPRFLNFERWWGGHFLLTDEEMRFIVDELFVGNKLTKGAIVSRDRRRMDLKAIRAPIVIAGPYADSAKPRARNQELDALLRRELEQVSNEAERGGTPEAILRVLAACTQVGGGVDVRTARLAEVARRHHDRLKVASADQELCKRLLPGSIDSAPWRASSFCRLRRSATT
jgi:pimeloyl-ACP methyl ester carboxylesterase